MDAPFKIGERVHPDQLLNWEYVGLTGRPGQDKNSVRRFKKGDWTLELRAYENSRRTTQVVSIRTSADDDRYWAETRKRLMRHKRQQR